MSDPTAPPADPDPAHDPNTSSLLRPRREAFEYGVLPISKLVFTDPIHTLAPLKQKLAAQSSTNRVDSASLANALQISIDHAKLVLDTLSSVLYSDNDPSVGARADEVDSVGADVRDLILFLYIQSYKKLLPRPHKDSAAVVDVWPSASAFDGYLSALSPLQLVRSNSRRFMPSQADDEAHQLSYLQKHLGNMISLLAEPSEGEGKESQVLTMENFEHLGLLIQFADKESDGISLSQAAPFFANSVPDMPAVPVPVAQVHDWLQQNIIAAQENISERVSAKENGPSSSSDHDVAMSDASITSAKAAVSSKGLCFIEGISKSSLVKQASDLKGSSVKVAPYNTFYSQLEEHLAEAGINVNVNKWDEPLTLGVVDPHDSLSQPAGVSDAQAESATCLDADQFTNFLIPNWCGGEPTGSTKDNPFPLPDAYMESLQRNRHNLEEIQQALRSAPLVENRKRELSSALHVYFKDWLYSSGSIRQLYCRQVD